MTLRRKWGGQSPVLGHTAHNAMKKKQVENDNEELKYIPTFSKFF
jgi:hypothetical protein